MTAAKPSKPKLSIRDGQITTTSLAVAEHFGKRHAHVLDTIHDIVNRTPREFSEPNFRLVEYLDTKGEARPMFRLTRDGFMFLAMGFTGARADKWKIGYINAFNLMEKTLRNRVAAPMAYTRTGQAIDPVEWAPFGLELAQDLARELQALLGQSASLVQTLVGVSRQLTGLDELGLSMVLTGMRVPDAQLYAVLMERCHAHRQGGARWVKISVRQLALDLGWTTPGKVRAALDRLRGLGLIDVRQAEQRRPDLEYIADLGRAEIQLARVRAQIAAVPALQRAFALRQVSPMQSLVQVAVPRLQDATAGEAERYNMTSTERRGVLVRALLDDLLESPRQALADLFERQSLALADGIDSNDLLH